MEIIVLVALALLIAILVGISFSGGNTRAARRGDVKNQIEPTTRTCPLCGSGLSRGERVRSVFYPSPGDTLAEIHGCRHCEGEHATQRRTCPVCKNTVPPNGHVIARVFKRPDKTHIHVLGCTSCRTSGRR